MGQVTIYLDEDTQRRMESAVQSAGISKSKWISDLIRRSTSEEWPQEVRDLAGAWPDFPRADEIRRAKGKDSKREGL